MYGLINGKIYTVEGSDWDKKCYEAMLVNDNGRIEYIGDKSGLLEIISKDTPLYDMDGKTIMPGFIDSHVHAPGTAFTELYQIDLFGAFEKDETLDRIRDYIAANPDKDEYWGAGYNMGILQSCLPEDMPCEWLDDICADKPITLRSYDCHTAWMNSCAMKKYNIDENTISNGTGKIHKNESGELKGFFTDTWDIIPETSYTDEENSAALSHFAKKMNKWGYTSIMSIAPMFNSTPEIYASANDISLRVNLASLLNEDTLDDDMAYLKDLKDRLTRDNLKVTTAKFMIDGVLEGSTAYLKEPYDDNSGLGIGYNSEPEWSDEGLVNAFTKCAESGFQIHCHCIGDAATTMVLDALDKVRENYDVNSMRNVITHLEMVDPDDIKRLSDLNIIAAIQTFWHVKEPNFHELIELPSIGPERTEKLYPAKSFVDNNIIITASGDYPVSFMNNPFMAIRAGVTRNIYSEEYYGEEITDMNDPRYLLNRSERLSVKDMIQAYTINGAYQLNREDEIGSLVPGKFADYVVLSDDPMTTDFLKLDKISVLKTVLNGKVVYGDTF